MKRPVHLPWDAAGWRSRTYEPRVTKVHGPVGETQPAGQVGQCSVSYGDGTIDARACQFCGYHVCSCERQAPTMELLHCAHCNAQLHEHFWHRCQPVPPSPGPAGPHVCPGHCEYNCRSCREHCKAPLIASLHCHLPKQPCVNYAPPAQKPEPIAYNFPLTRGLERGC